MQYQSSVQWLRIHNNRQYLLSKRRRFPKTSSSRNKWSKGLKFSLKKLMRRFFSTRQDYSELKSILLISCPHARKNLRSSKKSHSNNKRRSQSHIVEYWAISNYLPWASRTKEKRESRRRWRRQRSLVKARQTNYLISRRTKCQFLSTRRKKLHWWGPYSQKMSRWCSSIRIPTWLAKLTQPLTHRKLVVYSRTVLCSSQP